MHYQSSLKSRMLRRNVTIYDVSEQSGSSPTTVASVLNGTWKQRRVAEKTAEHILAVAAKLGYRTNLQARGLRTSKSRMIGMILPLHDNRYFSTLAEHFEEEARARSLCPVVVSTRRDPVEERRTVETLIAHSIDQLFIAGATSPNVLGEMCSQAGIAHINVDLPGTQCASVISDNYWGATQLTQYLAKAIPAPKDAETPDIFFIGGVSSDNNTKQRSKAFKDVLRKLGYGKLGPDHIDTCGYDATRAEEAAQKLFKTLGRAPTALFVNSTIAFEGIFRFLNTQSDEVVRKMTIGCYDWDPFLSHLHFPVAMVRQDARAMIAKAFELLDSGAYTESKTIQIQPELFFPS
jgi:LacI family transcriptional regulator, fructose operon transcriptional repressor